METFELNPNPGRLEGNQEEGFSPRLSVAEVLNRWPQTVPIFIQYHTSCVGCYMSGFETLEDAANIYNIKLDDFLFDLQKAIEHGGK